MIKIKLAKSAVYINICKKIKISAGIREGIQATSANFGKKKRIVEKDRLVRTL